MGREKKDAWWCAKKQTNKNGFSCDSTAGSIVGLRSPTEVSGALTSKLIG